LDEKIKVQGEAVLEDVHATCRPPGVFLSGLNGRLSFTESSLPSLEMNLIADHSPVSLTGSVRFGGEEVGATGELLFDSPAFQAGDLAALLGAGEQARGTLEVHGSVGWQEGIMGWKADLHGDDLEIMAGSYRLPARDLQVGMDGTDHSLTIRSLRVLLQENELQGKGHWHSLNPLKGRIDIQSPLLDLDRLLHEKKEKEPWEIMIKEEILDRFRPREDKIGDGWDLRIGVKCQQVHYREVVLSNAVAQGGLTSEKLSLDYLHGNSEGGSVIVQGEADLQDPQLPFSLLFGLSKIRTETYCRWFSLSPDFIQGTASVEGSLLGNMRPSGSGWKELSGAFSLYSDGCTIKRYDLLSKTLTLINFTQWTRVRLSDLYARGVPCRQIKGAFRLQKGKVFTDDLLMDTSIALVAFKGSYDILQDRVDAEVTLRPMEQLDQVLDFLPLVGKVISGPDGTFVVFHYEVKGPPKDLQVELIPFKNLNTRFDSPFQKLNGWLQNLDDRLQGREPP